MESNRHFTLVVIGDNPEELVKPYDNNIKVEPYKVYEFAKAKEYLLKADVMKEDAEVKKFLGIIYGTEGNPAEAYKYFSKSAQLNPNDPIVQQYAAQSKMEAGL